MESRRQILSFTKLLMIEFLIWQYLLIAYCSASKNNSNSERDSIMKIIFQRYNIADRPSETEQTNVTVYMKILAINSVDVRNMQFTTDLLLRQEWIDQRLSWSSFPNLSHYNSSIVAPQLKDQIWLPDLFFRNGKKGYLHTMTKPNYLTRISPEGKVLYSQKITMIFACQMNLKNFPMDQQVCTMNIGSYGYELHQLKFIWRVDDPIVLDELMQISEFNTPNKEDTKTWDCTKSSSTATGKYTCLIFEFTLQRQLGSYLASTYIPNILIIMVSWLNFWVSVDATPARVALGLLTLLGMLTQASTVSSTLPKVSYIKAIDIWTIMCIMFIIGVLVEFAIATVFQRKLKTDNWENQVRTVVRQELSRWCNNYQQQQLQYYNPNMNVNSRRQLEFCEELEMLLAHQEAADQKKVKGSTQKKSFDNEIDVYSRFIFPACFALYNCLYWSFYLVLVNEMPP